MILKRRFYIVLAAILVLIFVHSDFVSAGGRGVTISPTRVIFDGRARSAVVYIVNSGEKEVTYRISLTNLRMNEAGKTEEVLAPSPDEIQAKELIRFAPRQATLPPGGKQAIRLMVRKPYALQDGEYRTHLKVSPMPDENSKHNQTSGNTDAETQIKIALLVGVTIPVIIRHGDLTLDVTPESAVIRKDPRTAKDYLDVDVTRNGNRSALIDLQAYYQAGHDEEQIQIGRIKGAAIYTPNNRRIIQVPLISAIKTNPGGIIRVVIQDSENDRRPILGEKKFPVDQIVSSSHVLQ